MNDHLGRKVSQHGALQSLRGVKPTKIDSQESVQNDCMADENGVDRQARRSRRREMTKAENQRCQDGQQEQTHNDFFVEGPTERNRKTLPCWASNVADFVMPWQLDLPTGQGR